MNSARLTWIRPAGAPAGFDFAEEVRRGLTSPTKSIPCRFFYDALGSRLFEEICAEPEYYLTRAEDQILRERAAEIMAPLTHEGVLIELGSGSAVKTRHLIAAALVRRERLVYVPIDISHAALEESAQRLLAEFGGLSIQALLAEYQDGLALASQLVPGRKLVLWLGSNVGNFTRSEAATFLAGLARTFAGEDRLLLGVDLRKDARTLEAAYDDAAGVTARFNLHLLERINAELEGRFDLTRFRHRARYDEREGRIEMHLESLVEQVIGIEALGLDVHFERGERIHTENSTKYSPEELDALARSAGLCREHTWFDRERRFALSLLALPAPG